VDKEERTDDHRKSSDFVQHALRNLFVKGKQTSVQPKNQYYQTMKTAELTSHDGKSRKAKTRKRNQTMKNRNIQFKPTAGLLIPLLLACIAAVFISAAPPARAGETVPFYGAVSGYVTLLQQVEEENFCDFYVEVINFGNATELGAFTGTAEFYPNLGTGHYTGFFHWIAANGDKLEGTFEGDLIPTDTPFVFDNVETADVDGKKSTGRFANATGHFELGGQIDFTTDPPSFVLPWKENSYISTVGSNKK
jgi:hypothetical protein